MAFVPALSPLCFSSLMQRKIWVLWLIWFILVRAAAQCFTSQKHSKQNNAHTAFGGWMWSRNLEAPPAASAALLQGILQATCLSAALLEEILLNYPASWKCWGGNSWIEAEMFHLPTMPFPFLTCLAPQRSHCHWETSWPSPPAAVSLPSSSPSVGHRKEVVTVSEH